MARGSGAARADRDTRRLLFHSLVLAVTIPILLRFAGGEPLLSAWILTQFIVFYLFLCAYAFSTAATPLTSIFHSLAYGYLLAVAARFYLTDVLGMVIMYLDSVLAAGWFGSTLAEHRASKGAEKAAAAVAAGKSPVLAEHGSIPVLSILALGCAARVAWVLCPVADYCVLDVAVNLLGCLTFLLFFCVIAVLHLLDGAILGEDSSFVVVMWFAGIIMLLLFSLLLLGELGAVSVLWLCVLASTAFVGYCLRAHFLRSQPPAPAFGDPDDKGNKVRLKAD